MLRFTGMMVAFCACLVTPRASAQQRPPTTPRAPDVRLNLSAELGAVFFGASSYGQTLALFDHDDLVVGGQLAARALAVALPWLHVGGRLGWLYTRSGPAPAMDGAATPRVDPIDYHLVDLSGVLRMLITRPAPRGGPRVDFGVEAGVVLGAATLRGVGQTIVAPRTDVSVFIGHQGPPGGALVGARVGYQWLPWNGAEDLAYDPAFAGFHLGLEAGWVR